MRLPTISALAALSVFSVCAEAHAQGSSIQFQVDANGYGSTLLSGLMPQRVADWGKPGTASRIEYAQVQLAPGDQPDIVVRAVNDEMCDADGCVTFVFHLEGAAWKVVFQDKTTSLGVGPRDPSTMSPLVTADGSQWAWNGTRYDAVR